MTAEEGLAARLLPAFREEFPQRAASAKHLAELVLDAVDAVLPLEQHAPADAPLQRLEQLAPAADVFSYEGAPGWDVVLAEGLARRAPREAGGSPLEGLGAQAEREQQRGELKRRARALAKRLLEQGRDAGDVVALHATLLRLFATAAVGSALLLPEDPQAGELPPPFELRQEIEARSGNFQFAHEEWLANLQRENPVAAQHPAFRRYFAGLSQCLRAGEALAQDELRLEPVLGVVGGWQPVRWAELRGGAPARWFSELCPAKQTDKERALDVLGRLWTAKNLSATGFSTLYALFMASCASLAAHAEETL